jgi:hypothetical protein
MSSRSSGGLSAGKAVGMSRPMVTNNVRQPTSNYNPPQNYNSPYRPTYQQPQVINTTSNTQGGTTGIGMGTVAMAAVGGYMLNGIMHDRSGAVYNGPGYSNGQSTASGQYAPAYNQQPQTIVQQQPSSISWWSILAVLVLSVLIFLVVKRVVL